MIDFGAIHRVIREKYHAGTSRSSGRQPIVLKANGRDTLAEVFCALGMNKGVEIGVKSGDFSKVLCLANPSLELSSIDPWDTIQDRYQGRRRRYYRRAVQNLAPFNAKLIRKTSQDALADFPDGSLDFAYIDGNHMFDFACPDIIFWSYKVRSGGIVACHDYFHFRQCDVVAAVDAYIHSHNISPHYTTMEVLPSVFWVKP